MHELADWLLSALLLAGCCFDSQHHWRMPRLVASTVDGHQRLSHTANASTLGELLEVPQLMDACLRNGSYDEVLDLKAFVAKLGFMHGCVGLLEPHTVSYC